MPLKKLLQYGIKKAAGKKGTTAGTKDYADKKAKKAPADVKPKGSTRAIMKTGTLGELKDRLAKAKLELKNYDPVEGMFEKGSGMPGDVLKKRIAALEKQIAERSKGK